ncbi:MAG: Stk1 family PASTA domain-containing Ser/Thr kinase [Bacilli bacterium]|nr:Stk1 family PASTA domain-containing Ser/Thr kinase [Bacilli bacterium]MDD4795705.1 Stk1 family PASTA domain-containing Ser/Thr kinase [Bacilli bacterium]
MITKGQKINDRYQIVKTIGEGGMANVYLARDVILERNVAVKVLRGDLSTDEKFVRRFQREALSASSLSHPNIVEVYDVGEDSGLYYIVMEYIEGKHLKQLLRKRGNLTLKEVIDIMIQITDGMASAHDSYIIHRDIKPQNIMILENGLVKITDFGIAMALNGTQLTQTNSVMGSVHYLPPEQASGKGSTIQSDIYSMGILMYELLSGKLPYRGDNAVEIALKHLKDPLPSIRKEMPNLSQAIENIILKSTAKNPKNRYADAREMNEDLKTCLDEKRASEDAFVYEFTEDDDLTRKEKQMLENQKEEEINKKDISEKEGEIIAKKITEKDLKKKENKTLLILGAIFTGLILITTSIILLLPKLTEAKDVIVPSVVNMSVAEAEKALIKNGLKVAAEIKEVTSDTVPEGKIVKTNPGIGRTVKEGRVITLYQSSGEGTYEVEDFTGRNYIEVKTILERVNNLFVIIEEEEVDDTSEYNEGQIIRQEPEAGTKLTPGDKITLYIPDMTGVYPDFREGEYSLTDIEAFANKYNLTLKVEYQQTNLYEIGTIIDQNPKAGTTIVNGMTLKIVIAEEEEINIID